MASVQAPPAGGQKYSYQAELNESFYTLDSIEQEFLSSQTGIDNPEELKKHALQVQKEAYAVSRLPTSCRTDIWLQM